MSLVWLAAPLSALAQEPGWTAGGKIHVRTDNASPNFIVFLGYGSNSSPGVFGLAPGIWHTVDATVVGVPADAQGVFLAGLLIITHGVTPQLCNVTIAFRAPGDGQDAGNYIGQAIETDVGAGQRSNLGTWVPLVNGRFELQWRAFINGTGGWPSECGYAITLHAQAYVR